MLTKRLLFVVSGLVLLVAVSATALSGSAKQHVRAATDPANGTPGKVPGEQALFAQMRSLGKKKNKGESQTKHETVTEESTNILGKSESSAQAAADLAAANISVPNGTLPANATTNEAVAFIRAQPNDPGRQAKVEVTATPGAEVLNRADAKETFSRTNANGEEVIDLELTEPPNSASEQVIGAVVSPKDENVSAAPLGPLTGPTVSENVNTATGPNIETNLTPVPETEPTNSIAMAAPLPQGGTPAGSEEREPSVTSQSAESVAQTNEIIVANTGNQSAKATIKTAESNAFPPPSTTSEESTAAELNQNQIEPKDKLVIPPGATDNNGTITMTVAANSEQVIYEQTALPADAISQDSTLIAKVEATSPGNLSPAADDVAVRTETIAGIRAAVAKSVNRRVLRRGIPVAFAASNPVALELRAYTKRGGKLVLVGTSKYLKFERHHKVLAKVRGRLGRAQKLDLHLIARDLAGNVKIETRSVRIRG